MSDTPFPTFIDAKRRITSPYGALREALANYARDCREERMAKDIALDGILADKTGDGYVEFDKTDFAGGNYLYVDDAYSLSVLMAGEGSHDFSRRRKTVGKIVRGIGSPRVRMNQYKLIESRKQFDQMRIDASSVRGFGLILRRDAPYCSGETDTILKVPPL